MRELRQQVGMIIQNFNLFPHLTVGRNVMLAPTLVKARSSADAEAAARKLLERVGLAEKFDAWPDQLSGVLMVTHEMNFARKVSDRVVFMHAGRIHEMGPPQALFDAPQTAELKQFLSALH